MAEQIILVYKLFYLSINIPDFRFFCRKIATSPGKSHPLFPSKREEVQSPSPRTSRNDSGVHTMINRPNLGSKGSAAVQ